MSSLLLFLGWDKIKMGGEERVDTSLPGGRSSQVPCSAVFFQHHHHHHCSLWLFHLYWTHTFSSCIVCQYKFNLLTENFGAISMSTFSQMQFQMSVQILSQFSLQIYLLSLHSGWKSSNISHPLNMSKLKVWPSYPRIYIKYVSIFLRVSFTSWNIIRTGFFHWNNRKIFKCFIGCSWGIICSIEDCK